MESSARFYYLDYVAQLKEAVRDWSHASSTLPITLLLICVWFHCIQYDDYFFLCYRKYMAPHNCHLCGRYQLTTGHLWPFASHHTVVVAPVFLCMLHVCELSYRRRHVRITSTKILSHSWMPWVVTLFGIVSVDEKNRGFQKPSLAWNINLVLLWYISLTIRVRW